MRLNHVINLIKFQIYANLLFEFKLDQDFQTNIYRTKTELD